MPDNNINPDFAELRDIKPEKKTKSISKKSSVIKADSPEFDDSIIDSSSSFGIDDDKINYNDNGDSIADVSQTKTLLIPWHEGEPLYWKCSVNLEEFTIKCGVPTAVPEYVYDLYYQLNHDKMVADSSRRALSSQAEQF